MAAGRVNAILVITLSSLRHHHARRPSPALL